MNAALLGLSHPHSGALLATLENLREIRRILLWSEDPRADRSPRLPRSRKAEPVSGNLDAVLARCDFAVVAVRHDQAAAVAHRVLAAGRHLLAEKPVGLTAAQILPLQRAAARAGLVAGVLYARRAHPCVVALRRHAAEAGPWLSHEARFLTTQVRFRDPNSWLFRRRTAGGGILLWLGCHYLDLLQHISGDPITGVAARMATRSGERIEVEDVAALTLEFGSGAVGTFHTGYTLTSSGGGYLNAAGYDAYLSCNGRTGRLVWPGISPAVEMDLPAGRLARRFRLRPTDSYGGASGEAFVRQYVAAIHHGAEPPASLADAVRTARIIEAAEFSSRTHRMVRVAATAKT